MVRSHVGHISPTFGNFGNSGNTALLTAIKLPFSGGVGNDVQKLCK